MGSILDRLAAAHRDAGGLAGSAAQDARTMWRAVAPGGRAWTGAAWGLLVATGAILAIRVLLPFEGWPSLLAGALGLLWGMVGGAGVFLAAGLLSALPGRFRFVLAGCLFLLWFYMLTGSVAERTLPTLYVVTSSAITGAALGVAFRWSSVRTSRLRMAIAAAAFFASAGAGGLGLVWLFAPGGENAAAIDAAAASAMSVPQLDLPDPSQPGPARVQRLFYGSGTSLRRPEFGREADLRTPTVDGSRMLRGWKALDGWARTRYWGFDARALPLNGRLFHPEGPGPFPIVIAAHGGHAMGDASDEGYDYLGEHLASHGYVFVSVDENFLNAGAWVGLSDSLGGENAARGWLLLEHLRALRGFNEAEGPLHGKLDLGNVALVGHSKGGEAITLATLFNRLSRFPDDATLRFDYGFGIRALVALSTIDKQYLPAGAATVLEGVDYLALQGSHDADVEYFQGAQQYQRIRVKGSGYHFKETVYVHRANHGQWNHLWGHHDKSRFPGRLFFNRRPILSQDEQERVAKAYLTAFFSVSLRGDLRYLPFLQDHRAGRGWLPETIYLTRFEDSTAAYVARFTEDVDVTTTTLPGGHISGEGLSVWREQPPGPGSLWSALEGRAAYVGWNASSRRRPSYTVELPPGFGPGAVEPDASLVFGLADAHEPASRSASPPARRAGPRAPIDLTVGLADGAGHTARLPLGAVRLLQPQLETTIWKAGLRMEPRREIVFQTFSIPLSRFIEQVPALQLADLRAIRFVFDRTPEGVVVLDDIGFARPPATATGPARAP